MSKLKDSRVVKIFFSSPFGGMEDEREELTRRYFPQIHHLCNSHGLQFAAVDMRWGITAESSENSQVINICLRELDRSDMFVGFFGQRYGWHGAEDKILQHNFDNAVGRYPWLDKFRDKSVTELEFLHGFLNEPGKLPAAIFFRDKSYDDAIREEGARKGDKKQVFKYSAESELSTSLMQDLKDRVWDLKDKSLGVYMDYKTPAEAAKIMFDTIMTYLRDKIFADLDVKQLTKHEELLNQHDAFLSSRCNVYVHGEKYLKQLNGLVNSDDRKHVLVTGAAGIGKSALLCNWISSMKQQASEYILFYHFAGFAESSTDVNSILLRIISDLDHQYSHMTGGSPSSTAEAGSETITETRDLMQKVLKAADKVVSLGKTLVIVIDGLDKVKIQGKIKKPLFWLPSKFPQQCVVVVSTLSSDTASIEELKTRQYDILELEHMSLEGRHDMSVKTLLESGKELSPPQLEKIVSAEMAKSPLFLKITLSELVSFGYFRLLDKKIDSLISSESVEELFQKVLERLEEDYNVEDYSENLVEQVMCSLALSHQGLSEFELKEIYTIPDHVWSPLYFAIEKLMVIQAGYIQFGFFEFKEAVKQKYLLEKDKKSIYLKQMIKYFEDKLEQGDMPGLKSVVKRPVYELPWLWLEMGDKHGLINCITNSIVFSELQRNNLYNLIDLWHHAGLTIKETADRLLQTFDNKVAQLYVDLEHKGQLNETATPGLQLEEFLYSVEQFLSELESKEDLERVCQRHLTVLDEGLKHGVYQRKEDVEEKVFQVKYKLANLKCEMYKQQLNGIALHEELLKYQHRDDKDSLSQLTSQGQIFNGMATAYSRLGNFDKMIEYCNKSIECHQKADSPDAQGFIGISHCNIGVALMNKEEYSEAIQYFDKAIQIIEKFYFGELPPLIGEILSNKGLCYRRQGNLEDAEIMYKKSLDVKINALGRNHNFTAMGYLNLSALEMYRENYKAAIEYSKQVIQIYENLDQTWSISYIQALENLFGAQASLNLYEDLDQYFMKVLEWRIKDGSMDNCIASIYREMAKYYIREKRFEDAYKIMYALLNSRHKENDVSYILMDHIISELPSTFRENLPHEFTLQYGVEKFPDNVSLIKILVEQYLVPAENVDEIARLINRLHSLSDMQDQVYVLTTDWCQIDNAISEPCLQRIIKEGLLIYPDNLDLMWKLSTSYRRQERADLALPLAVKVADKQLDNPGLVYVTAYTAAMADDMVTARFYCQHIVDTCDDETSIDKAKNLLQMIEKGENQDSTDEATKTNET